MPPEAPPRPGLLRCVVFAGGYFHAMSLPVRAKTFSTHVASKMIHGVRKSGLSTHTVMTLRPRPGAYRTRIDRPIRNVVFGVMPFSAQRRLTVVWYFTAIEPSVSPDLIL